MLSIAVIFASNRNGRRKKKKEETNGHVDFCQDQNLSESPPSSGIREIFDFFSTIVHFLDGSFDFLKLFTFFGGVLSIF